LDGKKKRIRHKPFTRADTGPFCGAPRTSPDPTTKQTRYCKQPAGFRTAHPGQGPCYKHGGARPIFTGRYSGIKYKTVKEEMIRQSELEQDIMDLAPEVHLLRSLVVDFINRYRRFAKALLAWYRDAGNTKPRRIMDISDAADLIDKVGKVIERMHKIQTTGSISLDTFKRVTEQMGIIVAKEVSKHFKDKKSVELFLAAVEEQWGSLALDAKTQFAEDLEASEDEDDD